MPLVNLSSSQAIETMKANGAAMWPKRGGENRLSPIAKPRLKPNFELVAGETVFTIGSCFARNVERELAARGFILPAHDAVTSDPDFKAIGTGVLNNYGAPSIYNEIHWALERDYEQEECFIELGGKWADMHLSHTLRPTDLDMCIKRRQVITEAYRQIPKCRVIVITLGLSEVWFDEKTGVYLNSQPRRTMLRNEPERFKLHVLSFDEVAGYLRKALQLIEKHGREDVRVLMTVSPVPLSATHRDIDVMEANAYSKAVLRVAAEHIRAEFDFIDYYPSFESVTLSDRSVAWQDDEVHVSHEIVAVNIGRMVNAYTGATQLSLDELRDRLREEKPPTQLRLIADHMDHLEHRDIATVYVQAAIRSAKFEIAEQWLDKADDPLGYAEAAIAFHKGEYGRTLEVLKAYPNMPIGSYRLKMRALLALGKIEMAEQVLHEWTSMSPNSFDAFSLMAAAIEDIEKATPYYERAMELSAGMPRTHVEYAERLLKEGRTAEAKALLADVTPDNAPVRTRMEKVLAAI